MEDPFSSYDSDQPSGNRVPTWAWVVGGLVVGGGCCLVLIIGVLTLAGPQLGSVFEEIVATLETETVSNENSSSDNETTNNESDGRLFSTAEAVLQRDNEPNATPLVLEPYSTNFNEPLDWAVGTINSNTDPDVVNAEVNIADGVLEFRVYDESGLYWTTASQLFANGTYEIEATAVEGTLDNGFGLLLMVDNVADDYYMFEISSDGYVWIGYYMNAGETAEPIVDEGWFASDAVNQGLGVTNRLRVDANDGNLVFFVNNEEVAQVRDFKLLQGDVGVFVETLGEGDVIINYDNFSYDPES